MANPGPLQIKRGPQTFLDNGFVLADGEPFLADVPKPDGTYESTFFHGTFSAQNQQGCGALPCCQGEPNWNLPDAGNPGFYHAGLQRYDTINRMIWVSNADGTWTGFCNCIAGSGTGPTSSSGAATSSGGILVSGCPGVYLPLTLFATLSGGSGGCSCFNGSYTINYDNSLGYWWGQANLACTSANPVFFMFGWADAGATSTNVMEFPGCWNFAIGDSPSHADAGGYAGTFGGTTLGSISCAPFDVASSLIAGNLNNFCPNPGTAPKKWEVTI